MPTGMAAMTKNIIIVCRRADLSRAAFRDHYEARHAPLGIAWFRFDKYVRNHVADDAGEPGFDCVAEFWPHDLDQIARAYAAAGQLFAEDDARFMQAERLGGAVDDIHLAGPPRGVDPPGTRKRLDLLRASALPPVDELARWARDELAASRATRITLDRPAAGDGGLQDTAVLHRWDAGAEASPPVAPLASALVSVHESPPELLTAGATRSP
jgi:hypothetical protein